MDRATPLRVGVVGLVSSYSLLDVEEARHVEGIRVVGAADLGRDDRYMADSLALPWLKRFPKSRRDYAAYFDVPVYESTAALYGAGVDAVILGTEEYLRTRFAVEALERGVHVFLPKPFAYTKEDASRLREAAAASSATLFPGLPHRWSAAHRRAAELLTPEALGRPVSLRASITHHLTAGPWKSDPTMAAGPEFEMGFYSVDALAMLAGSLPVSVTAQANNALHTGIPNFDFAKLSVQFASGALGSADFYCGVHYPFRGQEFEALGRDGAVWYGRGMDGKPAFRVYDRQGERAEELPTVGRAAELAFWADVCRRNDRETAFQWFELGCQTLAALLAFQESWRTGRPVEVTPL